MCTNTLIKIAY